MDAPLFAEVDKFYGKVRSMTIKQQEMMRTPLPLRALLVKVLYPLKHKIIV
jgi:hypothetical protein